MSHRKVHSQGSIPFAWEDKPGVSKVAHQAYPKETGSHTLNFTSPAPATPPDEDSEDSPKVLNHNHHDYMKIPLPPCPLNPPIRSASAKGLKWQADPFLLAYKECTKSTSSFNTGKLGTENNNKKAVGLSIGSKVRKSKYSSIFSCKSSCDVRDDNFVKLPPIPRDRSRSSK